MPPVGAAQPNWPLAYWTKFEPLHVESPAPKKFVVDAVVAKKEVVVAFVAVALPVIFKLPATVDEACDMKPLLARIVWLVVGAR